MELETDKHEQHGRHVRTCAGCGKRDQAEALVRVVLDPSSGELAVDLADGKFGRGAHVHPTAACVVKATTKGGFAKAFKTKVVAEPKAVGEQLVLAADRRIEGLLGGAKRARQLAIGSDLVREALREEKASLVVVACDAAAAADLPEVRKAIGDGNAVPFADKKRLGALLGKDEVAVCAVLNAGVASALASAQLASRPFRSEAAWWSEVR
jgi:predicted RNA-binding protein YlxR (DUF448 family)/ribosomal protein L7Ae-like RNA K-turn-binding protein